jgi:putative SOS response-associated peptidase YedK
LIPNQQGPEHPPIIKFHRYQVRPRGSEVEPPAHINMFNARLDSLQVRKTWNPLFMRQHGILSLRAFYEWVLDPETKKSRVIRISEAEGSLFWVPALHETWQDPESQRPPIHSFAIVTTDPPPEVSSLGHDRCPIVIGAKDLATWLQPTDQAVIMDLLQKPYSIHFKGEWAKPA